MMIEYPHIYAKVLHTQYTACQDRITQTVGSTKTISSMPARLQNTSFASPSTRDLIMAQLFQEFGQGGGSTPHKEDFTRAELLPVVSG
jgi:hypothetical protein